MESLTVLMDLISSDFERPGSKQLYTPQNIEGSRFSKPYIYKYIGKILPDCSQVYFNHFA